MWIIALALLAQVDSAYDPGLAQAVLTAASCACDQWRKFTIDEIKTERRYANIGGAVNLSKMYSLQGQLRGIDDQARAIKAALAKLHRPKKMKCSSDLIERLIECTMLQVETPNAVQPHQLMPRRSRSDCASDSSVSDYLAVPYWDVLLEIESHSPRPFESKTAPTAFKTLQPGQPSAGPEGDAVRAVLAAKLSRYGATVEQVFNDMENRSGFHEHLWLVKMGSPPWAVTLQYTMRGVEAEAHWSYDPRNSNVTALNRQAAALSGMDY